MRARVDETLADRVRRLFQDFMAGPPPAAPPRLKQLPFGLHVIAGTRSTELFPPGPLDVLRFYQRTHASLTHDIEYVVCVPEGATEEEHQAYAVVRFRSLDRLPFVPLASIERTLRGHYGSLAWLPPVRTLLERPESNDLTDEDPPAGPNRVVAPPREKKSRDRFGTEEMLEILRREVGAPALVSWIEEAFRHPPRRREVEHRYYLDAAAQVYVVRDHFEEGKALYRAETSARAPRPLRPR